MKIILAAVVLCAAMISPAYAVICGDFKTLTTPLVERYGEEPVAIGMRPNGTAVIIFLNRETGTWTLVTLSTTTACALDRGTDMELLPSGVPA